MRLGLEKLVKRYVRECRSISRQSFRSGTFMIDGETIIVYLMGKDRIEIYFDLPQQAQDVEGIVKDFRARSGPHAELSRSHVDCHLDILRAVRHTWLSPLQIPATTRKHGPLPIGKEKLGCVS